MSDQGNQVNLRPVFGSGTRHRRVLWAIVAVAVLLRVGAALYMGDSVYDLPGIFDQISYDGLAQRVAAGHGFSFATDWWPATRAGEPTAHWSYAMTLYLAAIYKLFGYHPLIARLIQAVAAGILMPLLTYRLAAKVSARKVALLAAAISAVYIYFFYYAAALMTETFYFLAILASLNLAIDLARWPAITGCHAERVDGSRSVAARPQRSISSSAFLGAWARWLALGLAAGCAVLFRQTFLLFVPFLLAWIWWGGIKDEGGRRKDEGGERKDEGGRRKDESGRRMTEGPFHPSSFILHPLASSFNDPKDRFILHPSYFILSVSVIALMILPWTIRNYRAFHQFVLLNTNAGYVFFWSNHPIHGTSFREPQGAEMPDYYGMIPPELLSLDEASLEKALMARGIQFVKDDPGRYVLLSLSRIKDHFVFWPKAESSTISNISRVGSFGVFLPFMLYGLGLSLAYTWRRRKALRADERAAAFVLLYLFIVVYTGIHVLTWTGIRYRLPVDTVLVIFAAIGLYDLYERLAPRGKGARNGVSAPTQPSAFRPPPSSFILHPSSLPAKRGLDLIISVPLLIVLSPLLLALAAVVRLDSPGPALYRRRVMARGGGEFDAFKFRTMRVDGDALLAARPDLLAQWQRDQKLDDDPRVTRAGRWLRRFSLDELPQLCNVAAGQMSLVGPRMIVRSELPRYGEHADELLSVPPGMTGLWQVSGRGALQGEARARLELEYVRTRTFWLDLKLLALTIPAALGGRGAR